MTNQKQIIKVKPDKDGNATIRLYGSDHTVKLTAKTTEVTLYGDTYLLEKVEDQEPAKKPKGV